ncbi:hypothetical protein ACWCXB_04700 [Streptomyces sp. NPDC001514]
MLWGSVSCGIDIQLPTQCPFVFDGTAESAAQDVVRPPCVSSALTSDVGTTTAAVRTPTTTALKTDDHLLMLFASGAPPKGSPAGSGPRACKPPCLAMV